jgi:multidrug resistance protein, MATE family
VSNELGAGNPDGARLVVVVSLSIIICTAVLVSVTLLSLRHFIGIAFSNEEEVVNYVTRMVPLLSISVLVDNLQGVLSGTNFCPSQTIIYCQLHHINSRTKGLVQKPFFPSGISRGCGWQHLGAYVNLGAFYLVGIPVALVLGFAFHLGGAGFWIGMIAGGAIQVTLLSIITAMTNWGKMVGSSFLFVDLASSPYHFTDTDNCSPSLMFYFNNYCFSLIT